MSFKPYLVALLILLMEVPSAWAQVPPSPSEVADYQGLHAAALRDDAVLIQKRVAAGAGLEGRDGAGRTALHVAAFKSNTNAFDALVAAGADVNALEHQAYDVVTIAAVANDLVILERALKAGGKAANITSPYDGTALIAAAHLGHAEVVKMLIDAGAPLDHVNNLGWTALIEVVVLGDGGPRHLRSARHLLQAGADPGIADRQGVTPLEHAKQLGYGKMVQLFERLK